jgi:hypothetical protein
MPAARFLISSAGRVKCPPCTNHRSAEEAEGDPTRDVKNVLLLPADLTKTSVP